MLIGKTIFSFVYGQANIRDHDEDIHNVAAPDYYTDYQDIDSIDGFFYLKTEKKTHRFCRMVSHSDYGVQMDEIGFSKIANQDGDHYEVSKEDKWQLLVNQKIIDLIVLWDKSWSTNLLSSKPFDIVFPYAYLIKTENGKQIAIIASICEDGDTKPFIDRLIITPNIPLAKDLILIKGEVVNSTTE